MTKAFVIGVLGGDGIGPEVTAEAVNVLSRVGELRDIDFDFRYGLLGGCAYEAHGTPLPDETLALCHDSDALLVGALGGPDWDHLPPEINPGLGGLLRLRREFQLYANLRPGVAYLPDQVRVTSSSSVDIMLVREAVGGAYFSPRRGRAAVDDEVVAHDTIEYTATQIRDIVTKSAQIARARRGKLASVDKSNVLESGRLWREVAEDVLADFPDLDIEHLYVDNCAMQLLLRPESFDVVVTENLFGDILSDEIAGIIGSLGLLPSASLRGDSWGLYEPVHGSSPALAGKNIANPVATILSAALMLRYSFGLEEEAGAVERTCVEVMRAGTRTADIAPTGTAVTTTEFGHAVCQALSFDSAGPR